MTIFDFSERSSTFLTVSWLSVFISNSRQRSQSHAGVFGRKTESINYAVWPYLQIFTSDSKLSDIDQQSERLDIQIFKKCVSLKMIDNDRLENVPPSLEVVRILNHAIKGMIKVNSWKTRSKLFQRSEMNHVV